MSESQKPHSTGISSEKKQIYLGRRQVDLISLRSSLSTKNFGEIYTIAHKIKGNSRLFDFSELEPIALELETAAKSENEILTQTAISKFEQILLSLENNERAI